jgi:hypothetical protein
LVGFFIPRDDHEKAVSIAPERVAARACSRIVELVEDDVV